MKTLDRTQAYYKKFLFQLSPRFIRILLLIEMLAWIFPPWAWLSYRRWTGSWPQKPISWWINAAIYFSHHIFFSPKGVSASAVEWSIGPIRSAQALEREDYESKGSCGSCQRCCYSQWMKEKAKPCPFLKLNVGCSIYASPFWDYYNCGRFPQTQKQIDTYGCPRFRISTKTDEDH